MDLFSLFAIWLSVYSIAFTFLPILQVLEWKKRGTADGFSSVNLVLPVFMNSCWLGLGYLTNDNINIFLKLFNIIFFAAYTFMFAYYQPKRQPLFGQLISLIISLYFIFSYVAQQDPVHAPAVMGTIAATTHIANLGGRLYEIKRVISFGHTEYIPAIFHFALLLLAIQWFIYGIWAENAYIAIANGASMIVVLATISLYFAYPPLTWRVPIIGTGPQQKKKK